MKRFWLFVVLAVALQSCSHEEGARPEISRDKLVDVLFDIHLTDGYLAYSGSRIDRDHDKIVDSYDYVLRKHNITLKQFRNTMKYYSQHVDDYEKLYNKVIEKLTKYETEVMNVPEDGSSRKLPDKPTRNRH